MDAYTGKWIVDLPRSVDYNHSGFCDPVITGLVGLRPRPDDTVEVNPLVPAGKWDWFCLDGVPYHGRSLTILYDKAGDRYRRGKGLHVLADGKEVAESDDLRRVQRRSPRIQPRPPRSTLKRKPNQKPTEKPTEKPKGKLEPSPKRNRESVARRAATRPPPAGSNLTATRSSAEASAPASTSRC